MNYKKIIRSKQLRIVILRLLSWIPDETMLKLQYGIHMGRKLNLKNSKRYTEKIQAYKCYYRNELMGMCVDKYEARKYVESKGLSNNLVKLYGVYHSSDKIDFDKLPDKFVIKSNFDSASMGVIICRDKAAFNVENAKKTMLSWNMKKHKPIGREWAYSRIKEHRIIIEEYLENKEIPTESPNDYKILCFNGEPKIFWVETERSIGLKRNYFDVQCNPLDVHMVYPSNPYYKLVDKKIMEELFDVARKLSKGFPHVRVDLYYTDRPIFGEMTFYTDSGYSDFTPDSFDKELGDMFDVSSFLPNRKLQ